MTEPLDPVTLYWKPGTSETTLTMEKYHRLREKWTKQGQDEIELILLRMISNRICNEFKQNPDERCEHHACWTLANLRQDYLNGKTETETN